MLEASDFDSLEMVTSFLSEIVESCFGISRTAPAAAVFSS